MFFLLGNTQLINWSSRLSQGFLEESGGRQNKKKILNAPFIF